MVQNDKDAKALLREIQSDPLLSVAQDAAMPHEEVYPITWDQQVKDITRTKSSLKNALLLIEYDPDSSKKSDEITTAMVKEQKKIPKNIGFACTTTTPKSTLLFMHWQHKVTNPILDGVSACFKDMHMNTGTLKILFTGNEIKSAGSSDSSKAYGYSFASEVLVDHPCRWDKDITKYIENIVDSNMPDTVARSKAMTGALAGDCTKAKSQIRTFKSALETQIRKLQKANSHTLLMLIRYLIPNALTGNSPVVNCKQTYR